MGGPDARRGPWLALGLAGAALVPGVLLRLGAADPAAGVRALAFGAAVVGSALLLSWAAEVARLDISPGLAVSVVAFIALLPEYAVDAVFTVKGARAVAEPGAGCPGDGGAPSPCSLVLANMTGGNRLLMGAGWALVVGVAVLAARRRAGRAVQARGVKVESVTDVGFLALALAYGLTLSVRSRLTLLDSVVLVGLFVAYTLRLLRAPAEEPALVGPAAWIGGLPVRRRRAAAVGMLVLAAGMILLCAEPFAEALVETGRATGVEEFLLVQWLAPLASEAPELLVAGLYASRLDASGLGTLLSAKVNQWALLVGTLPVVFALAGGGLRGLPLVPAQREELLLTAALGLFAVALLLPRRLTPAAAATLFALFAAQLVAVAVAPSSAQSTVRLACSAVLLTLALLVVARRRALVAPLLRDALRSAR